MTASSSTPAILIAVPPASEYVPSGADTAKAFLAATGKGEMTDETTLRAIAYLVRQKTLDCSKGFLDIPSADEAPSELTDQQKRVLEVLNSEGFDGRKDSTTKLMSALLDFDLTPYVTTGGGSVMSWVESGIMVTPVGEVFHSHNYTLGEAVVIHSANNDIGYKSNNTEGNHIGLSDTRLRKTFIRASTTEEIINFFKRSNGHSSSSCRSLMKIALMGK